MLSCKATFMSRQTGEFYLLILSFNCKWGWYVCLRAIKCSHIVAPPLCTLIDFFLHTHNLYVILSFYTLIQFFFLSAHTTSNHIILYTDRIFSAHITICTLSFYTLIGFFSAHTTICM